jgi:uncharacterized membrane protein
LSFESGKTLGKISSLLNVTLPVIIVPLVFVFMFISMPAYPTGTTPPTLLIPSSVLVWGALAGLGLVCLILFLVAMQRLAKYYNEPAIFKNVFYGIVSNIVGTVVAVVIEFAFLNIAVRQVHLGVSGNPLTMPSIQASIFTFLAFLVVALVFAIISAVFYMRAFNALGEKSGVPSFKTAGLLFLIGTVLTVIVVGGLLIWVAWIFAAIGFFSLKPSPEAASADTSYSQTLTSMTSAPTQVQYCTYCGAPNSADAAFCNRCGKQLTT